MGALAALIPAIGSLIGGAQSGNRGFTLAQTEMLKKLMAVFDQAAPGRAAAMSGALTRLPSYLTSGMQAPSWKPGAAGTPGTYTPGVYRPTSGSYPTFPGFNPGASMAPQQTPVYR